MYVKGKGWVPEGNHILRIKGKVYRWEDRLPSAGEYYDFIQYPDPAWWDDRTKSPTEVWIMHITARKYVLPFQVYEGCKFITLIPLD